MNEKSCITINCGCCGSVTGSIQETLLYDGPVGAAGSTHELLQPVGDYKLLLIEAVWQSTTTPVQKRTGTRCIIFPEVGEKMLYTCFRGSESTINFYFPTENTFLHHSSWKKTDESGISSFKIYGFQ